MSPQILGMAGSPSWDLPKRSTADLERQLEAAGFDQIDIDPWLDCLVPGDAAAICATAVAYAYERVTAPHAVRYNLLGGWTPTKAGMYEASGMTPAEAEFCETLILYKAYSVGMTRNQVASLRHGWLTSGLTPGWVCLCLAANVSSVEEAHLLRQEARHSEYTLMGLEISATERRINVRSLRFTGAQRNFRHQS